MESTQNKIAKIIKPFVETSNQFTTSDVRDYLKERGHDFKSNKISSVLRRKFVKKGLLDTKYVEDRKIMYIPIKQKVSKTTNKKQVRGRRSSEIRTKESEIRTQYNTSIENENKVLKCLFSHKMLGTNKVAKKCNIKKQTASDILGRLYKKNYIDKDIQNRWFLTNIGEEIARNVTSGERLEYDMVDRVLPFVVDVGENILIGEIAERCDYFKSVSQNKLSVPEVTEKIIESVSRISSIFTFIDAGRVKVTDSDDILFNARLKRLMSLVFELSNKNEQYGYAIGLYNTIKNAMNGYMEKVDKIGDKIVLKDIDGNGVDKNKKKYLIRILFTGYYLEQITESSKLKQRVDAIKEHLPLINIGQKHIIANIKSGTYGKVKPE